jgi:branched-chain amino acid transport system permease protein
MMRHRHARLRGRVAVAAATAVVAGLLLPRLLDFYFLQVVNVTLINAILALGLNIVLGFGGMISLAHAAFFGIGAYSFAIAELEGMPAILAAPFGVVTAAVSGLVLAAPLIRLRGHYLALATLGFGLIVGELFNSLVWLTGGADGITVPGIGLANDTASMLYLLLAVAGVMFCVSELFADSPLGSRVRAFRDDLLAARTLGINVVAMRLFLFCASAGFAGVAGVADVCLFQYINPKTFTWDTTFPYLSMVVVGGLGSSLGAVLGAVLYTFVPEFLRFTQQAYFAIFGFIVIIVVVATPDGLAGILGRLADRALHGGRGGGSSVIPIGTTAGKGEGSGR